MNAGVGLDAEPQLAPSLLSPRRVKSQHTKWQSLPQGCSYTGQVLRTKAGSSRAATCLQYRQTLQRRLEPWLCSSDRAQRSPADGCAGKHTNETRQQSWVSLEEESGEFLEKGKPDQDQRDSWHMCWKIISAHTSRRHRLWGSAYVFQGEWARFQERGRRGRARTALKGESGPLQRDRWQPLLGLALTEGLSLGLDWSRSRAEPPVSSRSSQCSCFALMSQAQARCLGLQLFMVLLHFHGSWRFL